MNTTQAIATAGTELETNSALDFLARIGKSGSSDGCFSLMCEIRRAPQHYSDEMVRTPGAIHHWEMTLLSAVASSRRRDLQISEMYCTDGDQVGSW